MFNLQVDTYTLNSLSNAKQLQLWTPILSFPNARQAEGSLVDSGASTIVLKLGQPNEDDISRANEAYIYEGVDSPLIMTRHSSSKATKNESSCPDEIPLQMLPMGIWGPENMKIENI